MKYHFIRAIYLSPFIYPQLIVCFSFQFTAYAHDNRKDLSIRRTATTQILIRVDLDEAPRFTNDRFVDLLEETAKAGDPVKQLTAFDSDLEVMNLSP